MQKVPRFLKEYAAHQKRRFKGVALLKDCHETDCINRINNAITLYQRGAITIDEAVRIINNAGYMA